MTERVAAAVTVRELLAEATARLAGVGVDTPRLDAEVLLAEVLDPAHPVGREQLVLCAGEPVEPGSVARFEQLLARRVAREPVAYIVGRRAFRQIELAVDRRVLIPRPETELLVEFGVGLPAGTGVVDVGTGSGAVALALKHERPDLEVVGSDVDGGALAVARGNAARLGLGVRFLRSDLLDGVTGRLDAVLANLPYVAVGAPLAPEIALFEPPEALFAGPDGLDVIRRLTAQLARVPVIALEVGFDQADAVAELLLGAGYEAVERLRDLTGHERVVVGRR